MRRRVFLQLAALAPALAVLELPSASARAARSRARDGLPDAAEASGAGGEATRLRPDQRPLLASIIERLVETGSKDAPSPSAVGVLAAVDEILARLEPEVREALEAALRWVEWWPFLGEGRWARFSSLDPAAQRESLEGWRTSRLEVRRRVFRALRGLSLLAYWSRPETWPLLGYPGPSVPRAPRPMATRPHGATKGHETLSADACVIGAGAGGSVVAALLAEAGRRVVLLEAGPDRTRAQLDQREDTMLPELYVEAGLQATEDGAVTVLQGRGLGGSTVPGLGYCARTPEDVLAAWREEHGVAAADELDAAFARIEAGLGVRPVVAEEVNALNAALRRGTALLGFHGQLAHHNRIGCRRSGTCLLGCHYGALRSMLESYLPRARQAGARVVPGARATAIGGSPGRRHVEARLASGRGLRVEAPVVVCAAGAIGTPLLLAASGLAGRSGQRGLHLRLQPSVVTTGVFSERIAAWEGMPAAWRVDEFQRPAGDPSGSYTLTPFSTFPAMTAAALPGSGPELFETLRDYPRLGAVRAVLRDRSEGSVRRATRGAPEIHYELEAPDRHLRVRAVKRSVEVLWASGASAVWVPFRDGALRLSPSEGLSAIDRRAGAAGALPMLSTEPMGTCRMGADPTSSVVDAHGEVHDAPGVFVSDASVLPSPPGVPPLITVAALADRSAQRILGRRGRARA
ncbi:MAG: GMC family oxidoreductase N-terminal domain-containing protein [Myxococcota bacterium]